MLHLKLLDTLNKTKGGKKSLLIKQELLAFEQPESMTSDTAFRTTQWIVLMH